LSRGSSLENTGVAIRLLLVDDHTLFLEGLANTLGVVKEFEIVGQAKDGRSALAMWRLATPDVGLVDISMPGMDGIETVRQLRAEVPAARVLMLTSSEDQDDVIAALDAGASGYVTKGIRYSDLVAAVREVHAGGRPLGEAIARKLASREPECPLTPREVEVLRLLREGLTAVEIADRLGIAPRTTRGHIEAIKTRLGAANATQAVAIGFERGLLPVVPQDRRR
jgi:DNA-binding NarL/FixJ family response regulator